MSFIKSRLAEALGLITKGHERSVKAKKNILASFIIKGLGIAISLVLVPLTINYVKSIPLWYLAYHQFNYRLV